MNDAERRARLSEGSGHPAIYAAVLATIRSLQPLPSGILVDVGCGRGFLRRVLQADFARYVGVDLIRYDGFPADCELLICNFDRSPLPLTDNYADVVAAVETIEHLENPRSFMRELARVAAPGGFVVVSTPNQLSLLAR